MKDIKRIAILTCLEATGVCSGAGCFNALNNRSKHFERYKDQDIKVVAFFHCNSCDADYNDNLEYQEKIERVVELNPHAVHVGICTRTKGIECRVITDMINYFESNGISVIRGTH